jgi:hypothetical protein
MMDSTIFSDIYLDLDLVREINIEIFGFGFGFGERNLDLVRETVSIFIIH